MATPNLQQKQKKNMRKYKQNKGDAYRGIAR
uniref:Uncharacterized protein n=1 Tax=Rhizophora mucronata TaxID=61149 RepID=A0A2P2QKY6_RHIMU